MSGIGPDFMRQVFPPELLERLGLMHGWALRMVLAGLGGQPEALADHATRIATYDDDPVRAASRYAGMWPGTRFTFAVEQVMSLIADLLDAAVPTDSDQFTNAQVLAGARSLIHDLVPADHQAAALAVADRMPSTGSLGRWPLAPNNAQLGELYFVTAMAAWLFGQPLLSPSRQATRRVLLQKIHSVEATARGVPEAERVDVTEQQALDLLDSLLGSTGNFTAFGIPAGQAAVTRDRSKRSLIEMDIVEATKAHLIEHPIRTDDTDRTLRDTIGQALTAAQEHATPDMTLTEQRRAAKLAARHSRRSDTNKHKRR